MTNDAMPLTRGGRMMRRETGGAPDARRDEGRQGRSGDSRADHECKLVRLLSTGRSLGHEKRSRALCL